MFGFGMPRGCRIKTRKRESDPLPVASPKIEKRMGRRAAQSGSPRKSHQMKEEMKGKKLPEFV